MLFHMNRHKNRVAQIRVIGFDWDGTLVNSMAVKAEAFGESLAQYYPTLASQKKTVSKAYLQFRGRPRFDQLQEIQNLLKVSPLSPNQTEAWSDLFTSLYIDSKPPLFPDTLQVLSTLKDRGYRIFLGSSVPEKHLQQTLLRYSELEDMFEYVLGSRREDNFRKGLPYLSFISEHLNIPISAMAFIGDATEDITTTHEAKALAIGTVEGALPHSEAELKKVRPDLLIKSLSELLEIFQPL